MGLARQFACRRYPALAALALLTLGPRRLIAADGAAVRLRWMPSEGPAAGYRIHARMADGLDGVPRDAGLPPARRDGTLAFVVRNLVPDTDYVFAVTAYGRDEVESGLSNQIRLHVPAQCANDADCADTNACTTNERCRHSPRRPRGQCVSDAVACPSPSSCAAGSCDPHVGCVVTPLPEGSGCRTADPCAPGVCTGGACLAPEVPASRARVAHFLSVSGFSLRSGGRRGPVLLARASFTRPTAIDPIASGARIELRGEAGQMLYVATLPAAAFRARRRGTLFVYHARPRAAVGGIRRLVIAVDGSIVDLALTAGGSGLDGLLHQPRLLWSVELGDACFRDRGLACESDGGRLRCG